MKFQLISSLLLLGSSCSTVYFNFLIDTQSQLHEKGSYSAWTIASKISSELDLKFVCFKKYMDEPLVTKMIRETLVNYEVLSQQEATFVCPEHLLLTNGRNVYKLKVIVGQQTAWSKAITLLVEDDRSDITTWVADNYDFHFSAYFKSKDYLWLRNILMHDLKFSTDEWILGCLMQVLNDNHFSTADMYNNIPWIDSLKKIFGWGNRLEEHMGHFGPWTMGKSETLNWMINRKLIKTRWHWLKACSNIDTLVHNLRDFFSHQTTKNNFGMMLNLSWHYDSGDDGMSLECAHVW